MQRLLATLACLGVSLGEVCDEVDSSFLQHSLHLGNVRGTSAWTETETFSLFVKFHKVGGGTWRDYLTHMTGERPFCSQNCGFPHWHCQQSSATSQRLQQCISSDGPLHLCRSTQSCTSHGSLGVIEMAWKEQTFSLANQSDPAGVQNLWADVKRFELLHAVPSARIWLPSNFQNKRILVTTMLREPVERIRSLFYYNNHHPDHAEFMAFLEFRRDYVAGNWTQTQFEAQRFLDTGSSTMSTLDRSCCEYETWLGQGSVDKANRALTTQFDLVGINERMNEAVLVLGKLYGFTAEEVAAFGREIPRDKDNSDVKLDYTDEEKALATFIANKSSQIYAFGNQVFVRQYLSLYNSEENMQKALAKFETLSPYS
mmetsp:Transcript_43012/g.96571  ORF Transcript_43012/g.96571 Transcript_43012/m.96571 type:complete len:371 (-) Transcript_43012:137-1249(-)